MRFLPIVFTMMILFMVSCSKNEVYDEPLDKIDLLSPEQLETANNFYDFDYLNKTNSHLADQNTLRNASDFIQKVNQTMKDDDIDSEMALIIHDAIGYPIWTQALELQEADHHVAFIPFAYEQGDYVSGVIIAKQIAGGPVLWGASRLNYGFTHRLTPLAFHLQQRVFGSVIEYNGRRYEFREPTLDLDPVEMDTDIQMRDDLSCYQTAINQTHCMFVSQQIGEEEVVYGPDCETIVEWVTICESNGPGTVPGVGLGNPGGGGGGGFGSSANSSGDNGLSWEDIIRRRMELMDMINSDPLALLRNCLDSEDSNIPDPTDLMRFKPPQDVIDALEARGEGWRIQDLADANGTVLNIDSYGVTFDAFPIDPSTGQQMTPDVLFEQIRQNFGLYDDGCNSDFQFNDVWIDGPLWSSDTPEGTIFDIDIPFDDGSVITSQFGNTSGNCYCWTFTTVTNPEFPTWTHPVSGNRQFGLNDNGDGTWTFYIRGVDRVSNLGHFSIVEYLDLHNWVEEFGFGQADDLWNCIVGNISNYISSGNGNVVDQFGEAAWPDMAYMNEYITQDVPNHELLRCVKINFNDD